MNQQPASIVSKVGTLLALGALTLGCEREVPSPVTLDEIRGPTQNALVDHRIAFSAELTYRKDQVQQVWYEPPPIMLPIGDSFMFIPQSGYYVDHHTYLHDIAWRGENANSGSIVWKNIALDSTYSGHYTIAATYSGNTAEGLPQIASIEVIAPN